MTELINTDFIIIIIIIVVVVVVVVVVVFYYICDIYFVIRNYWKLSFFK
jgi:hypothetical protein